jgi:hypothetical protein
VLIALIGAPELSARLLKPSQNGEEREILIVNSKRRLYFTLRHEPLVYTVSGPVRLEFITRYPVVTKKKKRHSFRYVIVVDSTDTIRVHHRYQVQKSIRSVQHPNHSYTYSGNYFINVPAGQHVITLLAPPEQTYPVLVRVLTREFGSAQGQKTVLAPLVHQLPVHLRIGATELEYFAVTQPVPLQVATHGPKTLRIVSRLEFEDWMGNQEVYRLRVRSGKKILGTYFFSTERSDEATVVEHQDRVPGKWRSCEIAVPEGNQVYTVELLEKDRTVLLRFLEY